MGINKQNKILEDLTKAYLEAPDQFVATKDADALLCSSDFDLLTINHKVYILAWVNGFETALWSARGWTRTEQEKKFYEHFCQSIYKGI